MGLLDWFAKEYYGHKVKTDFKTSIGQKRPPSVVEEAIKERQREAVATLHYKHISAGRFWPNIGGQDHEGSHYNLGEIAKALDVEAYFAASVRRHRELIMKEGWQWVGKNTESVEYIKTRMEEISRVSGEPIAAMIREGLTNLVAFGTSFFVVKRDGGRSTGSNIKLHGKRLEPISGIYSADPTTMALKKNNLGRPVSWIQKMDTGDEKKFDHRDVIPFTLDRKSGFTFGTPYVIPVLDDIRALRRIEELVELVTHKNTFPFFHCKVGTEKMPASLVTSMDGTQVAEVELYRQQIENMPAEGGLVTSERVEIILLGQEGKVLDLGPYLEHFENRVLGGLRLSGIDLGRGDTANRATAQSVTKTLVDVCTEIQNVFAEIWTFAINDILLMEGQYDINEDNRVHLVFPEIDREELRAHQNHGEQLFLNNLITEDEFRNKYMRLQPFDDEERLKTNFELYTKSLAIINAVDEPFTAEAKASSRAVANKTQPANQFGIATTKKSISVNSNGHSVTTYAFEDCNFNDRTATPSTAVNYHEQVDYHWLEMMRNLQQGIYVHDGVVTSGGRHLKSMLRDYTTYMVNDAKKYLMPEIERGYAKGCEDTKDSDEFIMSKDMISFFFNKYVRSQLMKVNRKAMIMLKLDVDQSKCQGKVPDSFEIAGVFQALQSEICSASYQQTDLAFKFGYIESLKNHDCHSVIIVPDGSDPDDDWISKDPVTKKLTEVHWRDYTNLDHDRRYVLLAKNGVTSQGEEHE